MSPTLVRVISRGFACGYASAAPCRCKSPLQSGDVGCVIKNLPDPPLGLCSIQMILPHWQLIFCTPPFNSLTLMSDQDRISPYNINAISSRPVIRTTKKHWLKDCLLIQYHILQTNVMRIVRQTVRRITNEIVGVKGLRNHSQILTYPQDQCVQCGLQNPVCPNKQ